MPSLDLGIAGAGLLGRLLAWQLAHAGYRVSVFDPAPGPQPRFDGRGAAAFTAAGMLSPLAELDNAGPEIAALGWRSIALWRAIVATLPDPPAFEERGSLLLAHRSDLAAAQRVLARLSATPVPALAPASAPVALSADQLAHLEPGLQPPGHAWLLSGEAQIEPVHTMFSLHRDAPGVSWHWGCQVTELRAGALLVDGPVSGWQHFDAVFDVRGLGARPELPLRGVRGETVWLHAAGHGLTRPVRLLHPRHRVYLVPRPGDIVLLGATEIESEDRSPMSLRSAVELMAAAHSVMPSLAEARILRLDRNLRPALPDNRPYTEITATLVRINGLFRHGWLLAPALVEGVLAAWSRQRADIAATLPEAAR
ncbi:FAD-dependent oxidoreductase [Methylibium sp.]|uniref:FAD-dependent oxidoreductase n=1 Tax=Methylibium sp. TaxID=2067992 RepID=UPI003D14DB63